MAKPVKILAWMKKEVTRPQTIAEELLAIAGCIGEESPFSARMWPLVGWPHFRGWLYKHMRVGSIN